MADDQTLTSSQEESLTKKFSDASLSSQVETPQVESSNDDEFSSEEETTGGYWGRRKPLPNAAEMWKAEEKLTVEERRKRYRRNRFIEAQDIPRWSEISKDRYPDGNVPATRRGSFQPKYEANDEINSKLGVFHGDITSIECDAVVNAANESCLGGGGIDGAIHYAAGNDLYEECRTLGGCPTGQTKITRGYDLPAKYVLHTVGPRGERPKLLQSCYETCLQLALENKLKTVVFCGVSTGIFGYPLYAASEIALDAMRKWLEVKSNRDAVDKLIICTFLGKEQDCYAELIPQYFPPVPIAKSDDRPTEEKASDEKPSDDKPSEEKPSDEKVSDEKVSDDKPSDENTLDEKLSDVAAPSDKVVEEVPVQHELAK